MSTCRYWFYFDLLSFGVSELADVFSDICLYILCEIMFLPAFDLLLHFSLPSTGSR